MVQVRRAEDRLTHRSGLAGLALEEPAQRVAALAVPFGPAPVGRKRADLIEAAGVPRFGDELTLSKDGIEGQRFEQRRVSHRRPPRVPAENGRQVETETVDVV